MRPSIYGFKEGLKAFESYNRCFKKPVAGLRRDDDTAEIALAIRGSIITRFAKRLLALLSYSCHYGILHDSYSCSTGNQAEASCATQVFSCLEDIVLFIGTKSDVSSSMWNGCARAK